MPIADIAYWFAMMMMFYVLYMNIKRGSMDLRKGDFHIQAKRGTPEQLDAHYGDFGEIILDKVNWKLRIYEGGDSRGGRVISEKELYDTYKNTDKLFMIPTSHPEKNRFGGSFGYKFYSMTSDENRNYIGPEGEIVDIPDRKILVVHDGKTPGGHIL